MTDSSNSDSHPAGLLNLVRRFVATVGAAVYNRGELFAVELQEEKTRLMEFLLWTVIAGLLGMMFLIVATATVIFLFPEGERVYAAVGFGVFYLLAALLAVLNLRALSKNAPIAFSDTVAEARKDAEWLESLK